MPPTLSSVISSHSPVLWWKMDGDTDADAPGTILFDSGSSGSNGYYEFGSYSQDAASPDCQGTVTAAKIFTRAAQHHVFRGNDKPYIQNYPSIMAPGTGASASATGFTAHLFVWIDPQSRKTGEIEPLFMYRPDGSTSYGINLRLNHTVYGSGLASLQPSRFWSKGGTGVSGLDFGINPDYGKWNMILVTWEWDGVDLSPNPRKGTCDIWWNNTLVETYTGFQNRNKLTTKDCEIAAVRNGRDGTATTYGDGPYCHFAMYDSYFNAQDVAELWDAACRVSRHWSVGPIAQRGITYTADDDLNALLTEDDEPLTPEDDTDDRLWREGPWRLDLA